MKRMLFAILGMMAVHSAIGQYFDKYYGLGISYSTPLSNRSYIDESSIRSYRFTYRELINEHVSAGIDVSYASYNDYIPGQVYQSGNQSVFTDFYPYTTQIGLGLAGEYLFRPDKKLIPFAGLTVGAAYSRLQLYYNIYSNTDNVWSPLLRPYGGAMVRLGTKTSWGFFATAALDHSFLKASEYGYSGFSSLGLQAGFVYLNW